MLCDHEAIKGPAELVSIMKPNEILSPSSRSLFCYQLSPPSLGCGSDQNQILAESYCNASGCDVHLTQAIRGTTRWKQGPKHGRIIRLRGGVRVHQHGRVVLQHDRNNDLITDGS
jgi:hypothetical protein